MTSPAQDHTAYWRAMGRAEFDRSYAQGFINGGQLFPWCLLTGKEKVFRVFLFTFVVVPVFIVGLFAMMAFLGAIIEGIATQNAQTESCKRQAVTPYEYHQCR
jgi:hypothetical protein